MDETPSIPRITDEEIDQSPELGALFGALAKAQGEMKPAKKDSKNPHFGNTYASLDSVWDAIREPLSKNELAVIQGTKELPGGGTRINTTLGHSSGQWMRSSLTLILTAVGKPTDPITMQALGSALSYGRRYGMSMVGVVTDTDDDGEAASRPGKAKVPTPAEAPHICEIHKVAFNRYTKKDTGEVWYSHKLEDKTWCNEGKAKAPTPVPSQPQPGEPGGAEHAADPAQAALDEAFGPAPEATSATKPATAARVDYSANGLLDLGKQLGWNSTQLLNQIRQRFTSPGTSLPNFADDERLEFATYMQECIAKKGQ